VRTAPWRHVTREKVEDALARFRGEIQQAPPMYVLSPSISEPSLLPPRLAAENQLTTKFSPRGLGNRFSALKMDGMPLYDYARKGIPLPRAIEKRPVTVHSLELVEWKGGAHPYRWPEKVFSPEQKRALAQSLSGVDPVAGAPIVAAADKADEEEEATGNEGAAASDDVPTAFVLQMRVSGGTYVRSIVHDLARELGSAGHVVTLTRSRQKDYVLEPTEEGDRRCVRWEVFEAALEDVGEKDADGWAAWEREVLDKLVVVDGEGGKTEGRNVRS
jgi:tRNA pseudouridine55 synthase